MWLLNTRTYKLHSFASAADAPGYAILSHCWEEDEVVFSDIYRRGADVMRAKRGWAKVKKACTTARRTYGYEWIWIDTCCIDKSSSTELSEAINSMFDWYQRADRCLVYLYDVSGDEDPRARASSFRLSRWFTRGWTLQELIAPTSDLVFYSCKWHKLGYRWELSDLIEEIARVDADVLALYSTGPEMPKLSVAKRMSWAAGRRTTRPEDRAYSLMGLFGVSMPVIYGEGAERAFRRLQLEIIRQSDDHTIFVWGQRVQQVNRWLRTLANVSCYLDHLLASSPDDFVHSAALRPVPVPMLTRALGCQPVREPHFYDTNLGLRMQLPLRAFHSSPSSGIQLYCAALACQTEENAPRWVGLLLSRMEDSDCYFCIRAFDPTGCLFDDAVMVPGRTVEMPVRYCKKGWEVVSIYIRT